LKEQTAIHQYKEASSTQLERCQTEIEFLQKRLKTQKLKPRWKDKQHESAADPRDSNVLQEAIEEIEAKNQQLEQQEAELNDLRRINEAMSMEKAKMQRSHAECAEANTALQQQLEVQKIAEQGATEDLKRRVSEYDEGVKTLRKQLKIATDKAENTAISDHLYESKIKKLTEDNRRATTATQALTQKHELTALGFEASRQENRALQDQLYTAEAQLNEFKSHSSAKLLRSVNEENAILKEQTIRLRGEVLALQAKIEEIESSAFTAVQSMQLLNSKVGGSSPAARTPLRASSFSFSSSSSSSAVLSSPPEGLSQNDPNEDVIVELIMEEDSSTSDNNHTTDGKFSSSEMVSQVDDEESGTDIEVDFRLEEQCSRANDKSAAALSPIVEDRLLRNIYHKYTTETSDLLTLTRYATFDILLSLWVFLYCFCLLSSFLLACTLSSYGMRLFLLIVTSDC
jgi:hypothetical protein